MADGQTTLADLRPAPGTKRDTKRLGRGTGSGQGTYAGKGKNIEAFREGGGFLRVEAWYKPDGVPWMLGNFARPDVGGPCLDIMSRDLAGEYRADNDVATGIVRFSWGTHEVQPGRSLSGCCMEFEGEFGKPEMPSRRGRVLP